nr:hypothetical protein [Halorussus halobius]
MTTVSAAAEQGERHHCGTFVTDEFRRVFGDDHDRAHRCSECDTCARLSHGSAVGVDVEIPDPETSPGRHGGEPG